MQGYEDMGREVEIGTLRTFGNNRIQRDPAAHGIRRLPHSHFAPLPNRTTFMVFSTMAISRIKDIFLM